MRSAFVFIRGGKVEGDFVDIFLEVIVGKIAAKDELFYNLKKKNRRK